VSNRFLNKEEQELWSNAVVAAIPGCLAIVGDDPMSPWALADRCVAELRDRSSKVTDFTLDPDTLYPDDDRLDAPCIACSKPTKVRNGQGFYVCNDDCSFKASPSFLGRKCEVCKQPAAFTTPQGDVCGHACAFQLQQTIHR